MKIRKGFISNSSSSSFIVAFKNKINKCEHCGRSDPDFISEYIERSSNHETELEIDGRLSRVIDNLKYQIEDKEANIKKYSMQHPKEPLWYNCKSTVADAIKWEEREIEDLNKLINKIKEHESNGDIVHEFSISYHDELCRNKFNEMIENGSAVIISSEEC
jgi:hypothetical protein